MPQFGSNVGLVNMPIAQNQTATAILNPVHLHVVFHPPIPLCVQYPYSVLNFSFSGVLAAQALHLYD
jgi:hypothetical protein